MPDEDELQPWPVVRECFGHRAPHEPVTCPQCDGSHNHEWAAGHVKHEDEGVPVRCVFCGGRKCDRPTCMERRHHGGPHLLTTGHIVPIGRSAHED